MPATAKEWHQYWIDNRPQWYIDSLLGEPAVVEHPKDKRHITPTAPSTSSTSSASGNPWVNPEGVANRTILTYRRMRGIFRRRPVFLRPDQ